MNERDLSRELLGAYVLGHLDGDDLALVETALADDAQLRHEADELRAVAQLLSSVGEEDFPPAFRDAQAMAPPPGLAEAVLDSLRSGTEPTDAPAPQPLAARPGDRPGGPATMRPVGRRAPGRSSRLARVAMPVGVVVLVAAVTIGFFLRGGAPQPGLGVVEHLDVQVTAAGLEVDARLVPHTWGTEVFLDMRGLIGGEIYLVDLEERDGRRVSAGTFIGDADLEVVCVMNGAVLREDVAAIVVTKQDGTEVMRSVLEPVDYRSI